jgi:hypothetical protein
MQRIGSSEIGDFSFNHFSPSELAKITGLGIDMQRVWRKREHLPANTSTRASFDTHEVLAIAVRYELSKLGVSPRFTEEAAARSVPAVLASILLNCQQGVAIRGTIQQVAITTAAMAHSAKFAYQISEFDGNSRFLWSCSPPEFELIIDIGHVTDQSEIVGHIMIDLEALGIKLAKRTPKPFVIIEPA